MHGLFHNISGDLFNVNSWSKLIEGNAAGLDRELFGRLPSYLVVVQCGSHIRQKFPSCGSCWLHLTFPSNTSKKTLWEKKTFRVAQNFLEISRGVLHFVPFFILSFPFTHKAFDSVEEAIVMGSLAWTRQAGFQWWPAPKMDSWIVAIVI